MVVGKRVSRCILLIIVTVIALILVGYVVATSLHLHNSGIFSQITHLRDENSKIEVANQKYQQQNDFLQKEIKNVTSINKKLSEEASIFRVQNYEFQESLQSLNVTNKQLIVLAEMLEEKQEDLKQEIEVFRNKTEHLSGQEKQLKAAEDKLQGYLAQFSNLRKQVESYSKKNDESLEEVMEATLDLFHNISAIDSINRVTNLVALAANCQFLVDYKAGFVLAEYNQFLMNVAAMLNKPWEELEKNYPFLSLSRNLNGIATFEGVMDVIKQLVAQLHTNLDEKYNTIGGVQFVPL